MRQQDLGHQRLLIAAATVFGQVTQWPAFPSAVASVQGRATRLCIDGVSRGNELGQARRLRAALEKTDPHSLSCVRLDTRLKKCNEALKLTAANIWKTPSGERLDALVEMQEEGVEWPLEVMVSLVSLQLKNEVEAPLNEAEMAKHCENLVRVLKRWTGPKEERPSFNVLEPSFGHLAFDDEVAFAKVTTTFYVNEVLIPLLLQSPSGHSCIPLLRC